MNKVFLSGIISDVPEYRIEKNETAHLTFNLMVRHHRQAGDVKRELYRINAWNGKAQWGAKHLKQGQILSFEGCLTQRQVKIGNMVFPCTEVTVEEFAANANREPEALEVQGEEIGYPCVSASNTLQKQKPQMSFHSQQRQEEREETEGPEEPEEQGEPQ